MSDRGIKGVVAAVKAIIVHLLVKDRVEEPASVGYEDRVMTVWGHISLAACFVRCALKRTERGGSGCDNSVDGGWYDHWRWELPPMKEFMPQSRDPWHGMIIVDATDEKLFSFPQDAVPFTSSRFLLVLSTAVAAADAGGCRHFGGGRSDRGGAWGGDVGGRGGAGSGGGDGGGDSGHRPAPALPATCTAVLSCSAPGV